MIERLAGKAAKNKPEIDDLASTQKQYSKQYSSVRVHSTSTWEVRARVRVGAFKSGFKESNPTHDCWLLAMRVAHLHASIPARADTVVIPLDLLT